MNINDLLSKWIREVNKEIESAKADQNLMKKLDLLKLRSKLLDIAEQLKDSYKKSDK